MIKFPLTLWPPLAPISPPPTPSRPLSPPYPKAIRLDPPSRPLSPRLASLSPPKMGGSKWVALGGPNDHPTYWDYDGNILEI